MKRAGILCLALMLLVASAPVFAATESPQDYEKVLQIHVTYHDSQYTISGMEIRYGSAPNLAFRDGSLTGIIHDNADREVLTFLLSEPGITYGDAINPEEESLTGVLGYSSTGEMHITVPYRQGMETFSLADAQSGMVLTSTGLGEPVAFFCTDYPQDPDCLARAVPIKSTNPYSLAYLLIAAVFTLSVLIAAAVAVIAIRRKNAAHEPEKRTILITDDDPEIVRLFGLLLEKRGFVTLTATSGKECLEILENQVPDLILLDILMEPMDGWQTLEEIKNNPTTKAIPALMLTGKKLTPSEARRYKHCIDDYIQKPCTPQEIYAAVDSILERRRALEETLIMAKKAGIEKEKVCELARLTKRMSVNRRIIDVLGVANAVPVAANLDDLDAMSVADYITVRNTSYEKQIEQLRAEMNAVFRLKGLPEFPL